MKKLLSTLVVMYILQLSLLSQTLVISQAGWQLLGATQELDPKIFNNSCINYIWKYHNDGLTKKWQLHIANSNFNTDYPEKISTINEGEGFWVQTEDFCYFNTEEVISSYNYVVYGITNFNPEAYNPDNNVDVDLRYEILDNYSLIGEFDDTDLKSLDVSTYTGFALFIYNKNFKIDYLKLGTQNIQTSYANSLITGNIEYNYLGTLSEFHNIDDGLIATPGIYTNSTSPAVLIFTTNNQNTLQLKLVE